MPLDAVRLELYNSYAHALECLGDIPIKELGLGFMPDDWHINVQYPILSDTWVMMALRLI